MNAPAYKLNVKRDAAHPAAILELLDRLEKANSELRDANLHIKQLERGFDRAMETSK